MKFTRSSSDLQHSLCVLLGILLHFAAFVQSVYLSKDGFPTLNLSSALHTPSLLASPSPHGDRAPRAAIISFIDESEILDILDTIRDMEMTFNSQYRYHWIFFSAKPLSETFRRRTSNATRAECLYEVIENMSVQDTHGHSNSFHQSHTRGNLNSLAKESRMQYYDWAWRVAPGVS